MRRLSNCNWVKLYEVYIYDNSPDPLDSLRSQVKSYIDTGFVTYVSVPSKGEQGERHEHDGPIIARLPNNFLFHYQHDFFKDCTARFQNRTKWIIAMDTDEHFFVTKPSVNISRPISLFQVVDEYISKLTRTSAFGKSCVGTYQKYDELIGHDETHILKLMPNQIIYYSSSNIYF